MKKYLLLLLICISVLPVLAQQQYFLSGRVVDSAGNPVAFTSVYIRNSTYGTVTNEQGNYRLKLSPGNYNVIYRFVGYREVTKKITINADEHLDIQLEDDAYQIKEFARYNKAVKDSAVDIMRKVIGKRKFYLSQVERYSCVVYIKGVQKLMSSPKALMTPNVAAALSVDSTGKGILYQNESISNLNFQQPDKIKETRIASRSAGQNTSFSYNNSTDFSVNFYNDVFTLPGLASHGFVSPVARNAMRYYHYNLLGKKQLEDGVIVDKIQVIPKGKHYPTFTGNIYIVDGDWRIYSVDLMLTDKDNELNLVDTLKVSQQYVPITDSVWQPLSVQYKFKGSVFGFVYEGYYLNIYNNYKLNPVFPDKFFNGERLRIDTLANSRDTLYWKYNRPVPLTRQENADYVKKDFMADMQKSINKYNAISTKNNFYVLPYLVFGYHASYRDDKDSLYIYPFIQTLFYNTVEGVGINLQATFKHFYTDQRSYSLTPDIRYGFSNKLLNASIRGIYNYDPYNRGAIFGGFGVDLLDLNNVGTRSLYFNTLSTLLSERNFVKYYRSQFVNFGYQHDITNNLLWQAQLSWANRTQLYNTSYYSFKNYSDRQFTSNNPLMPDAPADDRSELFPQNQALTFSTSVTLTFDQQYITRPTGRTYLPSAYPQIRLNYRKGINGVLGSDVNYDFLSVEAFHDHMQVGLIGYSSFKVVAGDFLNSKKLYFMDYNHFLGNQGTTFNPTPGNFHFLPFYTYSASGAFLEAHYEHNFTGYFLNRIPLIRRLKLDEIIGANYLSENTNRSYYEFFVGVQRLIFRVDYGVSYGNGKKYLQGFRIFYGIK